MSYHSVSEYYMYHCTHHLYDDDCLALPDGVFFFFFFFFFCEEIVMF